MTRDRQGTSQDLPDPETGGRMPAPNRFTWPFKRFFWALEKYLLWPIADSFKWAKERLSYRSPLAYIGATLAFAITAGAVAAAIYFHNESKSTTQPVVTQVPEDTGSVTIPTAPLQETDTQPSAMAEGDTLKGVVPSFETSADASGKSADKADPTLVKPADPPKSGPLKTAQEFATTFVEYEVGTKGAAKDFKKTATRQLAKALAVDPPRLPANGSVPKATVLNVVKGPKEDGKLGVSVALVRLGTSSELRLSMEESGKGKDRQWLVSEVRG